MKTIEEINQHNVKNYLKQFPTSDYWKDINFRSFSKFYNPENDPFYRKLITRIEVVKVTPQTYRGESVDSLISDPWKIINCEPSQQGCDVEFTDEVVDGDLA